MSLTLPLAGAINILDAGLADDVKEYSDLAGLGLCCEAIRRKAARRSDLGGELRRRRQEVDRL